MKAALLITLLMLVPNVQSTTEESHYGQVLIHTADGATYTVTGDLISLVYKVIPSGTVACVQIDNSIGLPPATNDIIMQNGFEHADFCWE